MITPEQIAKLPKWAQDHINTIQRQRDSAVALMNETIDNQTPSPMFIDDFVCSGEGVGPTTKIRYIQGNYMKFKHAGISLEVSLKKDCISLQWHDGKYSDVSFKPCSYQQAELVAKEKMR